ncbi:ribonuclease T2 [Athelia psychrophila]|uniref:ribonuclease T2 n=1 Tax=Athelia psychrophila TaxID=1759441 RepID=A0A166TY11_9AGAM|nr:ribonuclease T2 [Fibularhizoctonia sp. CBS 109695]
MIAILAVALLAGSVSATQLSYSLPSTFPNLTACASESLQYSCENTTVVTDSCCSVVKGGSVLQTQFWSTYTGLEKEGQLLPKGSWTIHGLWPDNCDGTYDSYCDLKRQYDVAPSPNVTDNGTPVPPYKGPSLDTYIKQFGRYELLAYMETYWINQGAPNWEFWGHEFSKHATCTSTFDVACYGSNYKEHMDLINFFDAVIRAYKRYPTYDILASAGITPSNKTTYPLSAIQNAVKGQVGALPYFGCTNNGTVLTEVWYYHHVLGTEQYGTYKNLDTDYNSTCSSTLPIWYYERTAHSEHVVG